MTKYKLGVGVFAFTVICAASIGAGAAPQVLALLATDQPVALRCDATDCRVELPTLCLQPERRAPQAGRGYRLADGQSVVLSGQTANGEMVTIEVSRELRFQALRTHVTVEARIARSVIARHGLIEPAIGVGKAVAVVPVARASDERPLTAREIAEASGPRRAIGVALIDNDAERMPAVRLTNRLINMLPAQGRTDPGVRARLWTRALEDAENNGIPAAALERARFNVSHCAADADNGRSPSLRSCLQGFNDDALEYLNTDLENALKSGS